MASDINNKTIASTYSSPDISYKVTYTAVRNTNTQVTYNFIIQSLLVGDNTSWFGTGNILSCNIKINDGYSTVKLKESAEKWSGGSSSGTVKSTKTLSVTCTSSASSENQTVTFTVTRPDGNGNSGKVSSTSYYVTSPALLTSTCSAPSVFIASPNNFKDDVSLFWSGASGGNGNDITGYEIKYTVSDDASIWGAETSLMLMTSESIDRCAANMSDKVAAGQYVKFIIRTLCSDSNYYSAWKYSNVIQRKENIFDIGYAPNENWTNSQIYFGSENSWTSCKVFFGRDNSWINIK